MYKRRRVQGVIYALNRGGFFNFSFFRFPLPKRDYSVCVQIKHFVDSGLYFCCVFPLSISSVDHPVIVLNALPPNGLSFCLVYAIRFTRFMPMAAQLFRELLRD